MEKIHYNYNDFVVKLRPRCLYENNTNFYYLVGGVAVNIEFNILIRKLTFKIVGFFISFKILKYKYIII